MSLIKCPDCGNEVSDEAPSCPKCGKPIADKTASQKRSHRARMILIAGIVILAVSYILYSIGGNRNNGVTNALAYIGIVAAAVGLVFCVREWYFHKR